MVAVKKGSVAVGSWGNTSIFKGRDGDGEVSEGVNLKRARCLFRWNVSSKYHGELMIMENVRA